MTKENKVENKKRKDRILLYLIIATVILFLIAIGVTMAYFSATVTDNESIKGNTGNVSLSLSVHNISTSANLDLIPLDNDLETLNKAALGHYNTTTDFDATKACIDINNYSVCQLYEVVVTNNGSVNLSLNGGVTSLTGTNTPNIACAVMDTVSSITNNDSCIGADTITKNDLINAGATKTYYILVYINNLDVPQKDKGPFTGTVEFQSGDEGKVTATFH